MTDAPKTSVFVKVMEDKWEKWDSSLYKLSQPIKQKNPFSENDLGPVVESAYVVVRQKKAKYGSPETLIFLTGPGGRAYLSINLFCWLGVHDHKSTLKQFGYPLEEERLG